MSSRWAEKELETIEIMAELYTVNQIAYKLNQLGYHRTIYAIYSQLNRLGYSARPQLNNYSCTYVAKVLNLNSSTVSGWVRKGWMRAIQRSSKHYQLKNQDLKQFLENPPARIKNRIACLDKEAIAYLVGR